MTARRIVVYTDLTDASIAAVEYGRVLAEGLGGSLEFLHVLQGPFQAGWTAEVSAAALPEVQQAMEAEAEQWLDRVLPEAVQDRFQASLHFETGEVASEIVRFVQANRVDVLVLATTVDGQGNQRDAEIAGDVVRECGCSVLVVRPPAG